MDGARTQWGLRKQPASPHRPNSLTSFHRTTESWELLIPRGYSMDSSRRALPMCWPRGLCKPQPETTAMNRSPGYINTGLLSTAVYRRRGPIPQQTQPRLPGNSHKVTSQKRQAETGPSRPQILSSTQQLQNLPTSACKLMLPSIAGDHTRAPIHITIIQQHPFAVPFGNLV
jgi:hypothetical protein